VQLERPVLLARDWREEGHAERVSEVAAERVGWVLSEEPYDVDDSPLSARPRPPTFHPRTLLGPPRYVRSARYVARGDPFVVAPSRAQRG
jgi:hypothetical protein